MVGWDTPEPIRSGRSCKTSHGAGYGQRTENPLSLDMGSVKISIRAKQAEKKRQGHKLGQVDEKYMKQAQDSLYGEFSVALEIPTQEVPDYIRSRLKKHA